MTTTLLAVIAVAVCVMASETVVFALVRLVRWQREQAEIREVAEEVRRARLLADARARLADAEERPPWE